MQYFFLAYYNYVFWPISFSIYLFNNIFLFLNIIRKSKKKKKHFCYLFISLRLYNVIKHDNKNAN